MMDERVKLIAGALLAGCAASEPEALETSLPTLEPDVACVLSARYEILPTGQIVEDDIIVGKREDFDAACAEGRAWAPKRLRGISVGASGDLWTNRRVGYVIDPDLPQQQRVRDAIAHWEAETSLDFVETNGDLSLIYFTNGDRCASPVGRTGGWQEVVLSTGKSAAQIVATGISPTGDVYTWYDDGMVSSGTSTDLDSVRAQYKYTLPPGKTVSDIVAIAIAPDSDVFTWYDDGTRSIGTSSDLDAQSGPAPYSLPPGKTTADIVEIDIAVDSDVYTWFDNGTRSVGTSTDLDAHEAPASFTLPAGYTVADIRGIAIAPDSDVFTWFDNARRSIGTSRDLDAQTGPESFSTPGHCSEAAVIHEIGHSIGLYHEQSHPDRDDVVRVFWDEIQSGKEHNFELATGVIFPTTYDPTSRMQYESFAFSTDGSPTILERATLGASVSTALVVDMSISPSSDVYTWWTDGTVTSGTSDDLELHRSRYDFSLPPGYTASDIIGISISKASGNVYTYYDNGRYSVGSSSDLDSISAPASFTLPAGYTVSDVLAIDLSPNGRTYTWYTNGRVSSGTASNLAFYSAPAIFTLAPGRSISNVLGIGIAPSGSAYAWYSQGDVSAGTTSTDLDSDRALYDFASRGRLINSSDTLTAGDVDHVEALYEIYW